MWLCKLFCVQAVEDVLSRYMGRDYERYVKVGTEGKQKNKKIEKSAGKNISVENGTWKSAPKVITH